MYFLREDTWKVGCTRQVGGSFKVTAEGEMTLTIGKGPRYLSESLSNVKGK